MKLQLNNSGSWKNVVTFGPEHLQHAMDAAENIGLLGQLAGSQVSWRVLDDAESVCEHWVYPGGWISARSGAGPNAGTTAEAGHAHQA